MTLPPDNDDVCEICKKMVKEARDQLESNETQTELREVFEGSCKLIHIKPIVDECIKLSDDFIVELVSMLTSQMNPQIVCATCGLCNNAKIDRLLAGNRLHRVQLKNGMAQVRPAPKLEISTTPAPAKTECDKCRSLTAVVDKKFKSTSFADFRLRLFEICRSFGSFSDSCSALVMTNAGDLHNQVQKLLEVKDAACEVMNMCPLNHKRTAHVEIINESSVGIIQVSDDQTCQFCEHMITHLRDILVANSTEAEFKDVMDGICRQLGKSKDECLSIVDQYYGMIYNFLVNHLDGQEICAMVGLCQQPGPKAVPIAPILPVEIVDHLSVELSGNPPRLDNDELISPVLTQLPIERIDPLRVSNFYNKDTCAFCEFFLHYIQEQLALPATESEVEKVIDEACDKLPQSVNSMCRGFVASYKKVFIALLIQEIDPSTICPGIGFCPKSEIIVLGGQEKETDKPGCPLCLLAIQEVTNTLKDNKTEENIRNALENLCSHLSKSLAQDCKVFVDAYSKELVDMLVEDLSPQEVCERLKLCNKALPLPPPPPVEEVFISGNIATNEIEDAPQHLKKDSNECVICEFVISRLEKVITRNSSEEEIEDAFFKICNYMPKTVEKQCNNFVQQYGRAVIELLVASADPKTVCTAIDLCTPEVDVGSSDHLLLPDLKTASRKQIEECALCQGIAVALQTMMRDPDVERDFNKLLEKACLVLPAHQYRQCSRFIDVYGPSIENILSGVSIYITLSQAYNYSLKPPHQYYVAFQ